MVVSLTTTMRVLILLAFLGTAVAVPENVQRIVGGTPTTVESYPYMSNMQYAWFLVAWVQYCGGSLINSRSVLSAAHCYYGDVEPLWRVLLGTSSSSSGGTAHTISQFIIHPSYDPVTIENDIAIVRLTTPATFGPSIAPASIPGVNYNLADGTVVTAIGWGRLSANGAYAQELQHVDINIISQTYCEERYAYLKTQPGFENWPDITDNMLCAGIQYVGGKDACQGDSGGPLAHNGNVVVGVTSWGYSCAHADYPGVNARVNRYTDWIVANA